MVPHGSTMPDPADPARPGIGAVTVPDPETLPAEISGRSETATPKPRSDQYC
jgi:hypothetical protein